MLTFICQSDSHCARLFRSSCKTLQSLGDFIFLYNTQSSAKRRTEDRKFSGRSLIKIRKRTRLMTYPWGTPDMGLDLSLAIQHLFLRALRQPGAGPLVSRSSNLCTLASCVVPCQRPLQLRPRSLATLCTNSEE